MLYTAVSVKQDFSFFRYKENIDTDPHKPDMSKMQVIWYVCSPYMAAKKPDMPHNKFRLI